MKLWGINGFLTVVARTPIMITAEVKAGEGSLLAVIRGGKASGQEKRGSPMVGQNKKFRTRFRESHARGKGDIRVNHEGGSEDCPRG